MPESIHSLPALLVVGAMVPIFVALERKQRSARVRLWVLAWYLIFAHHAVDLISAAPPWNRVLEVIRSTGALLAGFAFLISVSPVAESRQRRIIFTQLAVTATAYSALLAWHVSVPALYVACLASVFVGGAAWIAVGSRKPLHAYLISLASVVFGTWSMLAAMRGNALVGYDLMMVASYGAAALVFGFAYRRLSPGVCLTCASLALSCAAAAVKPFASSFVLDADLVNAANFLVAFGMILLLLEDESRAARHAQQREYEMKVQVQKFADITSRLLSGADVRTLCAEIAHLLVEATTFRRASILLADEQRLQLAGHAGISPDELVRLKNLLVHTTLEQLDRACSQGRRIGRTAVITSDKEAALVGNVRTTLTFDQNLHWKSGDELLVPLRSRNGALAGLISMDDPREVERVNEHDMSTVELLGADLAVALENAALQQQLVRSEKLAAIGHLVGGVAHELNNPLTAVLGYSEILSDESHDEPTRRGAEVIRRESLRMKQIIANLQHLALTSRVEHGRTNVREVLHEVVQHKRDELAQRGIELICNIDDDVPEVSITPTQFRHVIVHLLSNAVDAVEGRDHKRIFIEANGHGTSALVHVIDTGPGFTDLQRAFDPFFTTKTPGKGAGLGLSICYGLVRQQGGSITAQNLEQGGACVTVELPLAESTTSTAKAAAGKLD